MMPDQKTPSDSYQRAADLLKRLCKQLEQNEGYGTVTVSVELRDKRPFKILPTYSPIIMTDSG